MKYGGSLTVLQEILEWSQDGPTWQRDTLRRIVLNGELSEEDIVALTNICKSRHGLAEQQEALLLSKEHVPDKAAEVPVSLVSIFHYRGCPPQKVQSWTHAASAQRYS